jgi:hypothetical protein
MAIVLEKEVYLSMVAGAHRQILAETKSWQIWESQVCPTHSYQESFYNPYIILL